MKYHGSLCVLVQISICAGLLVAQDRNISSGELLYKYFSPHVAAYGIHVTDKEAPSSVFLNPATAAGFRLPLVEVNGIALFELGDANTGNTGGGLNAAFSLPTDWGVFSFGGHFFQSDSLNSSVDFGTLGGIDIAYSKEVYSDFFVGLGLGSIIGTGPNDSNALDWGLGLDLGLFHQMGDLTGFIRSFKWGFVLNNIGIGYDFGRYDEAIPENITPGVGVAFNLVEEDQVPWLRWGMAFDVRAPTFTDLFLDVGTYIELASVVRIETSVGNGLRAIIDGQNEPFIPSVGISVTIPLSDEGSVRQTETNIEEMNISGGAVPLYEGVWGFGSGIVIPVGISDRSLPELDHTYDLHCEAGICDRIEALRSRSEPVEYGKFVSPNNDGIQERLRLVPQITNDDEKIIAGYEFIVHDGSGKPIHCLYDNMRLATNIYDRVGNRIDCKSVPTGTGGLATFPERLVSPKQDIPIVPIDWNGDSNLGDGRLPDGAYHLTLSFWDENGNKSLFEEEVYRDTEAPNIVKILAVGADNEPIFSPARDKTIVISQEVIDDGEASPMGTVWIGAIFSASDEPGGSEPLYQQEWLGRIPDSSIMWDGKVRGSDGSILVDESGADRIFADGSYIYQLQGIDAAGNEAVQQSDPFQLDATRPGIDRIEISQFEATDTARTGGAWLVDHSPIGNLFDSRQEVPTIAQAPTNSNAPKPFYFSPVVRNKITITHRMKENQDETTQWTGAFYNDADDRVYQMLWSGRLPALSFSWNGTDQQGDRLPDGAYRYELQGIDAAGNHVSETVGPIVIDTLPPSILALDATAPRNDRRRFSPAIGDRLTVTQRVGEEADWIATIYNDANMVVHRSARRRPEARLLWDGTPNVTPSNTGSGARSGSQGAGWLPDGVYRYELQGADAAGNRVSKTTGSIVIDTLPPSILALDATAPRNDRRRFSPAIGDRLTVTQRVGEEADWIATIYNDADMAVHRSEWRRPEARLLWDGTPNVTPSNTGSGARSGSRGAGWAPDGAYRYELQGADAAGNRVSKTVGPILIDTTPPSILALDATAPRNDRRRFSPAIGDRLTVTQRVGEEADWIATIYDDANMVVHRSEWRRPDARLLWDGTPSGTATGTPSNTGSGARSGSQGAGWLPDGVYRYELQGADAAGNRVSKTVGPILIDTLPPSILALDATAPRNDRRRFSPAIGDRLTVTQRVGEEADWIATIYDDANMVVHRSEWRRPDARLLWDGTSSGTATGTPRNTGSGARSGSQGAGWLPDGAYRYELQGADAAGNRVSKTVGPILIDTTPPSILALDATAPRNDRRRFSPAIGDRLTISQRVGEEADWIATIYNDANMVVHRSEWRRPDARLLWDGTPSGTATGTPSNTGSGARSGSQGAGWLPDGVYRYELQGADAAGNRVSKTVGPILIDTLPPSILALDATAPRNDRRRFSPAIGDRLTITQQVGEEADWIATIYDDANMVVHRSEWRRPDARLLWDGTPNGTATGTPTDTGSGARSGSPSAGWAPDGVYRYELQGADAAGNRVSKTVGPILIDTTPPSILALDATAPRNDRRLFSPAIGDRLTITQRVDEEADWIATIYNDVKIVVHRSEWRRPDARLLWDGTPSVMPIDTATGTPSNTGSGARSGSPSAGWAPDGAYRYELQGTDAAGNRVSKTVGPILIDTTPPSILALDATAPRNDRRRFSPAIGDRLTITQQVGEEADWIATIYDDANMVVHRSEWRRPAASLLWDGTPNGTATGTPTDTGSGARSGSQGAGWLPDGAYRYELQGADAAGNRVSKTVGPILIDTTPPSILALDATAPRNDRRLFSPAIGDRLTISQRVDEEADWIATIYDDANMVVHRSEWRRPDARLLWDGTPNVTPSNTGSGARSGSQGAGWAPDGAYRYELQGADAAGNRVSKTVGPILIDTTPPSILALDVTAPRNDRRLFSPAIGGRLTITQQVGEEADWIATIYDDADMVVHRSEWRRPDARLLWDGTPNVTPSNTGSGARSGSQGAGWAPDGAYRYELQGADAAGNRVSKTVGPILIDTTPPSILALDATAPRNDRRLFSPAIGGRLTITQQVGEEADWIATIYDDADMVVHRSEWRRPAASLLWDGMPNVTPSNTGSGARSGSQGAGWAPDGAYRYELQGADAAGNRVSKTVGPILIDTTPPSISEDQLIFPTGIVHRERGKSVRFEFHTEDRHLERWSVTISSKSGKKLYSDMKPISIDGTQLKHSITWGTIEVVEQAGVCTNVATFPVQLYLATDTDEEVADQVVLSNQLYRYRLEVTDEAGNIGIATRDLSTEPLIVCDVSENLCKIEVANILFRGGTAIFASRQDLDTILQVLSNVLRNYLQTYSLTLIGHATSIVRLGTDDLGARNFNEPPDMNASDQWQCSPNTYEQEQSLLQLSRQRAEAVRHALGDYGVDPNSINRLEGRGGLEPLVPHNWQSPVNQQDRSVNRRVEFLMERK